MCTFSPIALARSLATLSPLELTLTTLYRRRVRFSACRNAAYERIRLRVPGEPVSHPGRAPACGRRVGDPPPQGGAGRGRKGAFASAQHQRPPRSVRRGMAVPVLRSQYAPNVLCGRAETIAHDPQYLPRGAGRRVVVNGLLLLARDPRRTGVIAHPDAQRAGLAERGRRLVAVAERDPRHPEQGPAPRRPHVARAGLRKPGQRATGFSLLSASSGLQDQGVDGGHSPRGRTACHAGTVMAVQARQPGVPPTHGVCDAFPILR